MRYATFEAPLQDALRRVSAEQHAAWLCARVRRKDSPQVVKDVELVVDTDWTARDVNPLERDVDCTAASSRWGPERVVEPVKLEVDGLVDGRERS